MDIQTLLAVVSALAAAAYYVFPLKSGGLAAPAASPPDDAGFLLPVALPQHPRAPVAVDLSSPPGSSDALYALEVLRDFYESKGLSPDLIEKLISPHLSHLLAK